MNARSLRERDTIPDLTSATNFPFAVID